MSYEHVTFLLSLPRSRSAWLTEFVRPGCSLSLHDPLKDCEDIEHDLGRIVDNAPPGRVFMGDTAAMFFQRRIEARFPGAKFLLVLRNPDEVTASLRKERITPWYSMRKAYEMLISNDHWAYSFKELDQRHTCRDIYQAVTGIGPSNSYVQQMIDTNIQIPFADQQAQTNVEKVRRLIARAPIPAY